MIRKWLGTYASYNKELLDVFHDKISKELNNNTISLLDPMCGSGSLLVQCEKDGVSSVGYDINPVQVYQCNAKLANINTFNVSSVRRDIAKIRVREVHKAVTSRDWFNEDVVKRLIEFYNITNEYAHHKNSDLKKILNAAFILALRTNSCFGISSNPTWLKKGGMIPGTNIKNAYIDAFDFIVEWHHVTYKNINRNRTYGRVFQRDIKNLEEKRRYDMCITSPPYCNRLDYKRMMAPEYYFITKHIQGKLGDDAFIGDNVVQDVDMDQYEPTEYESRLLKRIKSRQLPDDKNYYYKYYYKYFLELDIVLNKIIDALKTTGVLLIAVQNSHYKDVAINLDDVVIEKIKDHHVVHAIFTKERQFFGNILKINRKQKETVLKITKNGNNEKN